MDINEQWQNFSAYSVMFRCVIHCARCGSGYIDGRGGRITCFACKNEAHWSLDRFRFARDMRNLTNEEHKAFLDGVGRDWRQGMDAAKNLIETETKDDFAWFGDVVRATETFLDIAAVSHIETSTEQGRKYDRARIQKLLTACRDMSDRIEATLNSLPAE